MNSQRQFSKIQLIQIRKGQKNTGELSLIVKKRAMKNSNGSLWDYPKV